MPIFSFTTLVAVDAAGNQKLFGTRHSDCAQSIDLHGGAVNGDPPNDVTAIANSGTR